ncbi:MAG: hypothetical protein PHW76_10175 [Alphaproteobacteria bacterium]|nr:hypothetical protein [Alphaproteobacteria bacterium]
MKFIKSLFLCTAGALWASPVFAIPACYNSAQVHAEQMLRLHSELMVITITCRQSSDGRALTPAYTSFTHRYVKTIRAAEQVMIAYYKTAKKGDPVSQLDALRTRLGNEIGQKVAKVSAPTFCAINRDKVVQFAMASPEYLEREVRSMEKNEPSYVSPCKIRTAMAGKDR